MCLSYLSLILLLRILLSVLCPEARYAFSSRILYSGNGVQLMKHEWKKHEKDIYGVKKQPVVIDVPTFQFFAVDGEGAPGAPKFQACLEALYSAAYAVRMSHKGEHKPLNYQEYTVYPLEGVWDLIDPSKGSLDKTNYKYTLMIRQPDFLTAVEASVLLDVAIAKKGLAELKNVRFESVIEGRCIQALHVGPFADEPATFEMMEAFCAQQGLERESKVHREIYLSDARKTAPEKMRTILRFKTR